MGADAFLNTFLARKKYHAAGTVGSQIRLSFHFLIVRFLKSPGLLASSRLND